MNNNEIPELPKMNDNEINTVVQEPQISNENISVIDEVKETANNEVKTFKVFMKDVHKYITSKNTSELLSLLWRLLIIAGFVILLYLPFQLLMDIGVNIFFIFGIDFTSTLSAIWSGVWYIIYAVLALFLFYKLCKDRFYKVVNLKEIEKKVINENIK